MSLDPLSADPDDLFSFMDINLDDPPTELVAPPVAPPPTMASPGSQSITSSVTTSASFTPKAVDQSPVSAISASTSSNPRFLRWMIATGLLEEDLSTWELNFQKMQSTYENFVEAHPFPQLEEEQTEAESELLNNKDAACVLETPSISMDLDPLTAMVQASESEEKRLAEMDLQYRKEKALRNRGKGSGRILPESEDYDESLAALQVIDKDLARLANPHGNDNSPDDKEQARREMLRRILFCYQCENCDPGYRQGMHEIASYLLYALELGPSGMVNARYQAALTYHLMTRILVGMAAAFDAGDALPSIGRRVDHIVRTHDPLLGQRLAKLQVPPQMYFTKWIRLLFAREVSVVLDFWDEAFFAKQNKDGNFMPLLEALTAARLLVWSAHFKSIRDEGQLLQTLMNLPVEPETHIWCQVARDLIDKPRGPLQIPPSNQQYRPAIEAPPLPTVSAFTAATLPASASFDATKGPSIAPLKAFLSEAGTGVHLGGWMEQISSKTQIIGQRVKQEWEHIAAAAANPDPQHVYQTNSNPKRQESSSYNITYRGEEPALYDPPVPTPAPPPAHVTAQRPLTRNTICKRLDQSSAVLHAFLMQQQSVSQVPSTVWQALSDLQKLSRELRPRSTGS